MVILFVSSSIAGCFGDVLNDDEEQGTPGGLALACLQDDKFEDMEIHFLFEKGYEPIAMELVKTRLQEVCDKPDGIKIVVEKQTTLKITGSDKQLVGAVASKIKTLRKIEPYKGKGVREQGQYVLKKEGKKK